VSPLAERAAWLVFGLGLGFLLGGLVYAEDVDK